MAINYCTVSGSTINTFCSPQRAAVLARLIAVLHPSIEPPILRPAHVGGGGGLAGNPVRNAPANQQRYANYQQSPRWEPPVISPESDRIIVTAKFQNLSGTDQQDVLQRLDIVYVTNLRVEAVTVDVNINNLTVNHSLD